MAKPQADKLKRKKERLQGQLAATNQKLERLTTKKKETMRQIRAIDSELLERERAAQLAAKQARVKLMQM